MVQFLLNNRTRMKTLITLAIALCLIVDVAPLCAASKQKASDAVQVPRLELEGGRELLFERAFSSQAEVGSKKKFWSKVIDIIAGEADQHSMLSPYSVVADSRGRILVSDPGLSGIHIFDFAQQKYKFISRDKEEDGMRRPQCIAVDASDNIYATDSESGKIFVFDSSGKFNRVIGSSRHGEGYFKRPTGIAVDSVGKHIFVTDTLRNQLFMLDMDGTVLRKIGKNGKGEGEFNFPTELRINGEELIVVDAMNFRIQVLDLVGNFKYFLGNVDGGIGGIFRPKGVAVDSEGHFYIVDGLNGVVQVFDRTGQLLYYFGKKGPALGEFQLPAGIFIDREDRVYVVDSYNRRVQVFHYLAPRNPEGARR